MSVARPISKVTIQPSPMPLPQVLVLTMRRQVSISTIKPCKVPKQPYINCTLEAVNSGAQVKHSTLTSAMTRCDSLRLVATCCDLLRLVVTPQNPKRPQLFTIFTRLRPPHRLDTYNIIKGEVSGGRVSALIGASAGPTLHWGPACLTGLFVLAS